MQKFWVLIPLLLPLMGCNKDDINRLLNGSAARSATGTESRILYNSGAEATQSEIERLHYLAPGQSTQAMHSVLGSPDSVDATGDYYYTPEGGMVKVPYDNNGKWTGDLQAVTVPQWQVSPDPGTQP